MSVTEDSATNWVGRAAASLLLTSNGGGDADGGCDAGGDEHGELPGGVECDHADERGGEQLRDLTLAGGTGVGDGGFGDELGWVEQRDEPAADEQRGGDADGGCDAGGDEHGELPGGVECDHADERGGEQLRESDAGRWRGVGDGGFGDELGWVEQRASLLLTSNGAVTQTAGATLAVTNTANFQAGSNAITLTNAAANNFGNLTLAGGTVSVTEGSGTNLLGTGSASSLTLVSGGDITQSGTLSVTGLATFNAPTTNDIVLGNTSNAFASLSVAQGRHATLADADGFAIGGGGINAVGTVTLNTTGPVNQTAAIVAGNLALIGVGGNYSLANTSVSNNVSGNVAANTGQVDFRNTTSTLTVGTANGVTGITTSGPLRLESSGTAMTIDAILATTSGTGAVTLVNGGLLSLNANIAANAAVAQTGTGTVTITGPRSIVTSGDQVSFASAVTLAGTTTSIDTTGSSATAGNNIVFAGTVTGSSAGAQNLSLNAGTGGDISFAGAVGSTRLGNLSIANANDVLFNSTVGVTTVVQSAGTGNTTINGALTATGGNVNLTNTRIQLNSSVTATGQLVRLSATASGVSQTSGGIQADNLELLGSGSFNISSATNNIANSFAANISGDLQFRDTGTLTVGVAGGTTGIVTGGGNVTLSAGGQMQVNQVVNAGAGAVTIDAGLSAANSVVGSGLITARTLKLGTGATTTAIGVTGNALQTAATSILAQANAGNIVISNTKATLSLTANATAGLANVSTSGTLSSSGAITSSTSNVTLTSVGGMTLAHNVTGPTGVTLTDTGASAVLEHSGGNISTTNANISLVADNMWLHSGSNTIIAGTGNITVRPNNTSGTIRLGPTPYNTAAGSLDLDSSELNAFGTSNTLIIGGASHSGAIQTSGSAAFSNPAGNILVATNGNINVQASSSLSYTGTSGNLTLSATSGSISGGGSLTATNVRLLAANGIGSTAAPVHVAGTATNLTANNTASGQVVVRASSGDLNLVSSLSNTGTGGVELSAADGSINSGTVAVSSGGALSMIANATGATARTLTVGTGGLSASGAVTLLSADDLSINGNVSSGGGAVTLVAGNASGMTLVSKATEPSDTDGGVSINAKIVAGAGNISIYATESVLQPNNNTSLAGLQTTGTLTVRTYNDTPQGAKIDLRNDTPTHGNDAGSVVLETRLAADASAPSEPAGDYAASDIDYKSFSGFNLTGVGTAANYTAVAATQNINLNALNIQAKNITLIANSGDVNVNVPIVKSYINRGLNGGSLSLLASGDINLNAASANQGVSIGKRIGTKTNGDPYVDYFNHDLRLVASNNIKVEGSIYITGNLSLRADAAASEIVATGAVKAAGNGSGGVSLVNPSTLYPLEVRAQNLIVGEIDGGNRYGVEFLTLGAGSGTAAAGANLRLDSILRAGIPTVDTLTETSATVTGGNVSIVLNGNLSLSGGTINATSTGAGNQVRNSAISGILGTDITICPTVGCNTALTYNAANSVKLKAGSASANNTAGGGAVAAADAVILASNFKRMNIGGDLLLIGGTANATGSAQPSATALIDPLQDLVIRTAGSIVLQAGQITGAVARGAASAKIVNEGNINLFIGGGGSSYTFNGPSGQVALGTGLIMIGGGGSGILDKNEVPLPGTTVPITITFTGGGSIVTHTPSGGSYAPAIIQTGVTTFDESLLSYIIFAANEETRASRIRRGLGADDDLGAATCQ
ncbi:MAG: S-layer family protein [Betaproteobacteria bacterium]|nr:S-layer family protein [Betaproteobacteria bacterium]